MSFLMSLRLSSSLASKACAVLPAVHLPKIACRGFSKEPLSSKERAEEAVYFNKEDEKLLRQMLKKMKAQADTTCVDRAHMDRERTSLIDIVGRYSMTNEDIEKLIQWRHRHDI